MMLLLLFWFWRQKFIYYWALFDIPSGSNFLGFWI